MTKRKATTRKKKAPAAPSISGKHHTIREGAIGWGQTGDEKGRGVFARRDLRKGEVIEIAPVIPVSADAIPAGEAPDGYLLMWDEDTKGEEHCMPLGYIMLYNHSDTPNIGLTSDMDTMSMTVTTLRAIKKGEELMWDYQCDIWFDEV